MIKRVILGIIFATIFVGIGLGLAFTLLVNDHPSIVVEEKWRVVTTAPPVTYLPETPFHMDPKVVCEPYVPPTTLPPATTATIAPLTTTTTTIKSP